MSRVSPGWAGSCPQDFAALLAFVSKRADWLHEFIADSDVIAGCEWESLGSDEFRRDIIAWLPPPKAPRKNGQWVVFNSKGELTGAPPPEAPRVEKPRSWAARDNPLYVLRWADRVLTAVNYWLNSYGTGEYPIWGGPNETSLPSSLKLADAHFCNLLLWCRKPHDAGGGRGGNSSVEEANQAAMKLAKKDPAFVNGGARDWAAAIRKATGNTCSVATVKATPFWQKTMKATGRGRTKGKSPKAVSLTDNMKSVAGEGERHEVLRGLIAEQEADYEPSPVDDNLPATRRKPKHHKRV